MTANSQPLGLTVLKKDGQIFMPTALAFVAPAVSLSHPLNNCSTKKLRQQRPSWVFSTFSEPGMIAGFRDHAILIVKNRSNLRVIDIGFVVIVETGINVLWHGLAFGSGNASLDRFITNSDRILGNRAGDCSIPDRIGLGLAGIITDHDNIRAGFLLANRNTDCRPLICSENTLEVRIGLQQGFGDFS